MLYNKLKDRISNSSDRTKDIVNSIILSVGAKGMSIISTLLIVPLTISYLSPEHYGIWLTLSSIVTWVYYFDLGLGNGFRNRFSEAVSMGDIESAKQYVSTAYFTILAIVSIIFLVGLLAFYRINWLIFLNLAEDIDNFELQRVMVILLAFMCLNMVVQLFGTLLTADQKIGLSSLISGLGQLASLIAIFVMTNVTEGSLENMALYFSGVPFLVMLIASIIGFCFTKYKVYIPKFSNFRTEKVKDILSLGIKFFLIYICLILIFQIINIVISREIGPVAVAQYNIANRYFSVIFMVVNLIVAPFWSACTEAYCKKDYAWMSRIIRKLEYLWFTAVVCGVIMLLLSPVVYHYWIKDEVDIPFMLSIGMFAFFEFQAIGSIYMTILNGIGKVNVQLIIYAAFAILSWPALVFSCRVFGLNGVFLLPTFVYVVQAISSRIQISRVLKSEN